MIRGGFRMTYDRIGSALAVNFDLNNLAGFTSARNINANTFDVIDGELGPQFGGFNPNVRTLPFPGSTGPIPTTLNFPLTVPSDEDQRIEVSLDQGITTPYNYSFNFSYGRELGKGLSFEASYVGRFARKLLASRDIMQLNNIRDPQSGMTYYEAVNRLVDLRYENREITSVPDIAFFNNFFPFMPEWWGDTTLTPTQAAYAFVAPAGARWRRYHRLHVPAIALGRPSRLHDVPGLRRSDQEESTTCSINRSSERSRRSRLLPIQTTTRCNSACVSGCATTSRLTSTTPTAIHSTTLPGCKTPAATALRSSSTR